MDAGTNEWGRLYEDYSKMFPQCTTLVISLNKKGGARFPAPLLFSKGAETI